MQPAKIPEPGYVYLLQSASDADIKLGAAADVAARAAELPDHIDLAQSSRVRFVSLKAALKTEKFLHALLVQHRRPRSHGRSGYTEWYAADARAHALVFLRDNQALLACSAVEPVPVPLVKPTPTPAELAEQLRKREVRRAQRDEEYARTNERTIHLLCATLDAWQASGQLLGWHNNQLVIRTEPTDQLESLVRAGLVAQHAITTIFAGGVVLGSYALVTGYLLAPRDPDPASALDRYAPRSALMLLREKLMRIPSRAWADMPADLQARVQGLVPTWSLAHESYADEEFAEPRR